VAFARAPVLRSLMVDRQLEPARYARVHDVRVPTLIYGTAWKEGDTARLVRMAIDAGFRGIDTANQRRHYFEAAVGEALASALGAGHLQREDVFPAPRGGLGATSDFGRSDPACRALEMGEM
jgi:hypothetical protein